MSANAVTFTMQRIVPRVIGLEDARRRVTFTAAAEPVAVGGSVEEIDRRRGRIDDLAERVAAGRERWTQLTFYLFDSNSWR